MRATLSRGLAFLFAQKKVAKPATVVKTRASFRASPTLMAASAFKAESSATAAQPAVNHAAIEVVGRSLVGSPDVKGELSWTAETEDEPGTSHLPVRYLCADLSATAIAMLEQRRDPAADAMTRLLDLIREL